MSANSWSLPMRWTWLTFAWLALLVMVQGRAWGETVASDTAADAAYAADPMNGAWSGTNPTQDENPAGTDNGGFGFQAWDFQGGFHEPTRSPYGRWNHFIDGVDFPSSSFNQLGAPAFGLTNSNQFVFGGHTARATRVFENPLQVGDRVSVDFDNPVLDPSALMGSAGFLIRLNHGAGPKRPENPGVKERFGLFATSDFSEGNWNTTDLAGLVDTGLSTNNTVTGARFSFLLTGDETYEFGIHSLTGGDPLFSRTGNLASNGAGVIDTIELLMFGNGSGNGMTGPAASASGEHEFFFDNVQIERAALLGDFDGSRMVDATDIDLLQGAIRAGSTDSQYDLDGSNVVDTADLSYLVETVLGTSLGDADLSGGVTASGDGAILLASLAAPQGALGWADADFDGDGNVTASADGGVLLSNLGNDAAAPAAVPEPATVWLALGTVLAATIVTRWPQNKSWALFGEGCRR